MRAALALTWALTAGCAATASPKAVAPTAAPPATAAHRQAEAASPLDRRLAFYEAKLAASPRHYPSLALLATAELDKAKETGEPSWLGRARRHVARSMELQPNFQAMKAGAAIASYSHHFAEALDLARAARQVYPPDTSVAALEVEALLGLGQDAAAAAALAGLEADDFHASFARGLVAAAAARFAEAAAHYERAAAHAASAQVPELERFALVSAAGALLDGGDGAAARPYLERAAAIGDAGGDLRLAVHRAEALELGGEPAAALAAFEALLARRDDAELHRQAARLARQLGDAPGAARHVTAARARYQRGLDAGEIYPLEGYSLLLSEAGLEPALALELARKNLEHKRDASARAALERAQAPAAR